MLQYVLGTRLNFAAGVVFPGVLTSSDADCDALIAHYMGRAGMADKLPLSVPDAGFVARIALR